jgi:hypothetical protein
MNEIFRIIREWFSRDHTRLALFLGIFSAGLSGYSLGILRDVSIANTPLAINIVAPQDEILPPMVLGDTAPKKSDTMIQKGVAPETSNKCAFVGSKNSNLYHLPSCASARRIKDENKRCFVSAEDAIKKGYRPGCLK